MSDPLARTRTRTRTRGGVRGSPPQSGAGWVLSARRGAPGPSPASGAPNPEPAETSGGPGEERSEERSEGRAPGRWAGERDCEPWVREKVLFLLHPERWLGTRGDAKWDEGAVGEVLPETSRDDAGPQRDCAGPRSALERRHPGARAAPAAPPRPLLVRVVDYQVTREVQRTAWTKGRATTRTEERSVTAVTFRTGGPDSHRAEEPQKCSRLGDERDSVEEDALPGTPGYS
ncbi:PREDICTED: uncharacterized protein C6orf141 homolog [Chinchilla lanigera]|uniref:uncharacterized protein C6orf141 homolog n=1 Tax=Chinchilla lanigera TaxID=34839 RepID=UPI00069777FB|nr:PREDICTED: uncharacterized protein C6orf141 homolog [Chinchilla lanigera]XP_013366143.1 PREDICTED: uncharacterized protein C6orf141 homolog [Chinchilla lanigera]XP_013366144.1 PREDICTED: uncharacterized protein C6orf141 homolog [Chinchilla lanigera]XP_013366145.1 PREDICTED: uncharacterized protein C6orf141 homolog [Chinchilla lanigera]XP_013366146.1 PREDICTED: uncharacterized protein C6orf141 homolog [Chinchilla lanigera]XP_013366147.1 PREDICTED: uncharacterized protein C6orf141 homolog [Ch